MAWLNQAPMYQPGGSSMKRSLTLLALICALAALTPVAHASFSGVLYVSNFNDHTIDSVKVLNGAFVAGSQGVITTLPGSDGIICNEKTLELLVGGQRSNNVYRVN